MGGQNCSGSPNGIFYFTEWIIVVSKNCQKSYVGFFHILWQLSKEPTKMFESTLPFSYKVPHWNTRQLQFILGPIYRKRLLQGQPGHPLVCGKPWESVILKSGLYSNFTSLLYCSHRKFQLVYQYSHYCCLTLGLL